MFAIRRVEPGLLTSCCLTPAPILMAYSHTGTAAHNHRQLSSCTHDRGARCPRFWYAHKFAGVPLLSAPLLCAVMVRVLTFRPPTPPTVPSAVTVKGGARDAVRGRELDMTVVRVRDADGLQQLLQRADRKLLPG